MSTLPNLDSTLFDWLTWRNGSIHDLGIVSCRYELIISVHGKLRLREYAIGWCFGESLNCRPKQEEIAVLFEKDDKKFWFHLRRKEFCEVFDYSFNN